MMEITKQKQEMENLQCSEAREGMRNNTGGEPTQSKDQRTRKSLRVSTNVQSFTEEMWFSSWGHS